MQELFAQPCQGTQILYGVPATRQHPNTGGTFHLQAQLYLNPQQKPKELYNLRRGRFAQGTTEDLQDLPSPSESLLQYK